MHKTLSFIKDSPSFKSRGFTIVELLIVIVVIAVLAAITIVAFNGVQKRAENSAISSKETIAKKALEAYKIQNDDKYPTDQAAVDTLLRQTPGSKHYATYSSPSPHTYYALSIAPSGGPVTDGVIMQTVTNATCPITRTRANDARDNRSYYIQKLADGKCWMLTNLAYGGGGTNTYNDARSITQATSGTTYTEPRYYVSSSANPTSGATNPATNGTQHGYHYNYCAAMGGQSGACTGNTVMPTSDQSISVCPAGWRLPTGGSSGEGEFANLDRVFGGNGISTSNGPSLAQWSPSGQFLSAYAADWIGYWDPFSVAMYWSKISDPVNPARVFGVSVGASSINPGYLTMRSTAISVRCLL